MSEHARLVQLALSGGLLPGERRSRAAQMDRFVGADDCSSYWPPCGGCSRCLQAQIGYYINQAADHRRRMARLGLLIAPRQIDWLATEAMLYCSIDARPIPDHTYP